jgi:hypothetical protein
MTLVEELDAIVAKLTSAKIDLMKFEVKENHSAGVRARRMLREARNDIATLSRNTIDMSKASDEDSVEEG